MLFKTKYDDPPVVYDLSVGSVMRLRGYSEYDAMYIAKFDLDGVRMASKPNTNTYVATIAYEDLADAIKTLL